MRSVFQGVILVLAAIGVLLWVFFLATFTDPDSAARQCIRPGMHADEAVQWSLARDASLGIPYSDNQDRFHGPALAVATRTALALQGQSFQTVTVGQLRHVPYAFYLLLCLAPLALGGVPWPARVTATVLLFFSSAGTYFPSYFIQEPLLVAGFVWGVLLWQRSAEPARSPRWALAAGAGFGLALACKVTAAAYLGVLCLALLCFGRATLQWRRVGWAALGTVTVWVTLQTSFFTDGDGLVAWGLQFWRSFGVAAGNEDTLYTTDWNYWWVVGVFLLSLVGLRLCQRERHTLADVPLACALGCYVFHLALPYKTPWLLFLPVCLALALVLPVLLNGSAVRWTLGVLAATVFVFAAGLSCLRHTPTHYEVAFLPEEMAEIKAAWLKQHPQGQFYIAVEASHYWPLPFYLRDFQVGFGDFAGSEQAPVRFIKATDRSRPVVPGYVATYFELRQREAYWMLVAE